MSEHGWLSRLGRSLGPADASVRVGIGDDAAVLDPPAGGLVWTVDACVEGVHFTRAIASLEDVGYRSFMAAVSDVPAMGGRPLWALSALVVPSGTTEEDLDALARGQRAAAEEAGAPVVGGNVSKGPSIAVTTSVLGSAPSPLLRSGARPGERLWLAGPVGLAAAGLRALLSGAPVVGEALRACVEAWRRPTAQIAVGPSLVGRASAAIDISDGLAQDAAHIARASQIRLVLEAERAVASGGPALEQACQALGLDPFAMALAGGEDYALLASSALDLSGLGLVPVGRVEEGPPGVEVLRDGSTWRPPEGFDHLGG